MKRINGKLTGHLSSPELGTVLSFRKDGTVQSALVKSNDTKTLGQTYQRLKLPNLAEFYKAAKVGLQDAFEDGNLYPKMVQFNISGNIKPVGLTRGMKRQGACIVMPYVVSQGSLPSISVNDARITDIIVKNLPVITPATTVGQLAEAIVSGNPGTFEYGDRICFFEFNQTISGILPTVALSYAAVTLTKDSDDLLSNLASLKGFGIRAGHLAMSGTPAIGGFCWIHTRRDHETGELLVSSQKVIVNNDMYIDIFTSADKLREAAESYKVNITNPVVLDPTSIKTRAQAALFGIEIGNMVSARRGAQNAAFGVEYNGKMYLAGDYAPEIDLSKSKTITVALSDSSQFSQEDLEVMVNGKACTNINVVQNKVSADMPDAMDGDFMKTVTLTDGTAEASVRFE